MLCCCGLLQQEVERFSYLEDTKEKWSSTMYVNVLGKFGTGKNALLLKKYNLAPKEILDSSGLCVNAFYLFCKRADWSRANPSGFPQAPSCFKPGYLAFPHIAGCRAICGLWHNTESPQTWPPQSHFMLHRVSVGALSYLMWTLCLDSVDWTPSREPLSLMTPWFCFAVTAASSWKVKASSRTRLQCVPPMNPTRWPAKGCRRWRRTAGAALPLRSNLEPHTQVRIGWRFQTRTYQRIKGSAN